LPWASLAPTSARKLFDDGVVMTRHVECRLTNRVAALRV